MEIYRLLFETAIETNPIGVVGIFSLGAAFGNCLTLVMVKLVRKRAKKQVKETARVGRLRAKRSWDA